MSFCHRSGVPLAVWLTLCVPLLNAAFPRASAAEDWPTWRYDAQRGSATDQELPAELTLQWARELPPAQPAWPDTQAKLQFDGVAEPVAAGKRLFVPSSRHDDVTALDTESGDVLWRFTSEGPVRFAPAVAQDRLYFVSDDGHLYCLDAETGALHWKVRGGPADRRVLGNHRLISSWPARGAPVIHEGRVYFAASIWNFMGIFIHCVDAQTGEIVWSNTGDGMNYTVQPHDTPAFASLVPQGNLVVSGNDLVVPGGRSVPAVYDLATGKLRFFKYDKRNGHYDVSATKAVYFVGEHAYELATGDSVKGARPAVFDSLTSVFLDGERLKICQGEGRIKKVTKKDRRGKETTDASADYALFAEGKIEGPVPERVLLRAGNRLFGFTADGEVVSVELGSLMATGVCKSTVVAKTEHPPAAMIAADDKLFVVDEGARLYCFGAGRSEPLKHALLTQPLAKIDDDASRFANLLLRQTAAYQGYAVVLGLEDGRLVEELLRQSDLYLVVVDSNAELVQTLRDRLSAAGLYGTRVSVHAGDPRTLELPPYLANLVVSERAIHGSSTVGSMTFQQAFRILRPYGGVAWFRATPEQHAQLLQLAAALEKDEVLLRREGEFTLISRPGPLPNTDNWTHQYGNPSQTGISGDSRVKAPLGILWFGGPSHDGILPRHGHGPSPQVAGGRLVIEGVDKLRAVDVYTGRLLWETQLKGIGDHYNITSHFPGASEVGSNYVTLPDAVYAVLGDTIWELDAATGAKLKSFHLEGQQDQPQPFWGFIAAYEDYLIATSSPVVVSLKAEDKKKDDKKKDDDDDDDETAEDKKADDKKADDKKADDKKADDKKADDKKADDKKADDTKAEDKKADEKREKPESQGGKAERQGGESAAREENFVATPIIPKGADWQYSLKKGAADLKWTTEEDGPEGWKTGPAGFGYGDDDDKTVLDMKGKYAQVRIRHQFQLESLDDIHDVVLAIRFDDGFVAFLNGKQVAGAGVKQVAKGKIEVGKNEADKVVYFKIKEGKKLLKQGNNVLALVGFNQSKDSSDFTLDPFLLSAREADPPSKAESNTSEASAEPPRLVANQLTRVRYGSGSQRLVVFNRHTGEKLWERDATYSFRHNNIAIGGGTVFCLDSITEKQKSALERRGVDLAKFAPRMLAMDLRNGEERWTKEENVFGSFLNYSAKHDLLIQGGSKSRDRAEDEVGKGLTALRAKTGEEVWRNMELAYEGPCLLWRDLILTNGTGGFAVDIHTGKATGWEYNRNYGCNTAIGGQNLLTFRSGAAGFFDLANNGGTGNLGGFRSSCTANLIVADGVLNAPDYTRTCTCAYQNQTSLALVHMPEADFWTFGAEDSPGRIGVNFGAPGDRRGENGTLWTDYPEVGGKSAKREVTIDGKQATYFRHHASASPGQELNWVATSGVVNPDTIRLKLPENCANSLGKVRLVFAEMEGAAAGERVFDVLLQGESVLSSFDIADAAGAGQVVIREFDIETGKELEIRLVPKPDSKRPPLLCGLELILDK